MVERGGGVQEKRNRMDPTIIPLFICFLVFSLALFFRFEYRHYFFGCGRIVWRTKRRISLCAVFAAVAPSLCGVCGCVWWVILLISMES